MKFTQLVNKLTSIHWQLRAVVWILLRKPLKPPKSKIEPGSVDMFLLQVGDLQIAQVRQFFCEQRG